MSCNPEKSIKEIQECFDQNPISLSFDMESISAFLGEMQEKFKNLKLEATISIEQKGNTFGIVADSLSILASALTVAQISTTLYSKKCSKSLKEVSKEFKDLSKAGEEAGIGFFQGFGKKIDKSIGKAKEFCSNLTDSIKNKLKIKSPSKVMVEIGEYVSEGLGDGIKDGAKFATKAMESLSDNVVDASKSLSKIEKGADNYKGAMKDVEKATDKVNDKKISFGGGFIAAIGIVATLGAALFELMSSNEEFSAKMEEAWGLIKEAFEPVVDMVMGFFDSFMSGSEASGGAMNMLIEIISSLAEFLAEILGVIGELFAQNSDTIMALIGTLWELISGVLSAAIDVIEGVLNIVVGLFTGNGDLIKEGLGSLWEGIKGIFSAGLEIIAVLFSTAWEIICNIFGGIKEWFSEKFQSAWDAVKGIFTNALGNLGEAISSWFNDKIKPWFTAKKWGQIAKNAIGALKSLLKFPSIKVKITWDTEGALAKAAGLLGLKGIPKFNVSLAANGGLFVPGEMFIAREAGPELVGSFGAKTAVMNNNQIVASVKQGVYEAVTDALRGNATGGQPMHIHLNLDGREVTMTVIKNHNQ